MMMSTTTGCKCSGFFVFYNRKKCFLQSSIALLKTCHKIQYKVYPTSHSRLWFHEMFRHQEPLRPTFGDEIEQKELELEEEKGCWGNLDRTKDHVIEKVGVFASET